MAEYWKGKTIDSDERGTFLKIEGERYPYKIEEDKYKYDYDHDDGKKEFCNGLHGEKLIDLGKAIIEKHSSTITLKEQRNDHIKELEKSVGSWNEWRIRNPHIRPILYGLPDEEWDKGIKKNWDSIKFKGLRGINFSNANLIEADLTGVDLTKANFHEANLGGAKLIEAILEGANFCRADLYKTNLSGADLTDANLQGAQIAGTIFKQIGDKKTQLIGCKVYGSSAWDLKGLDEATQGNLEIVYKIEEKNKYSELTVDDLEMAQFLYFILNNKNVSNVFNAASSSVVLILGRFKDRKDVLDEIRNKLKDKSTNEKKKYIPIIFDFDKPDHSDYTQVITVLAGISRFIIADLTNASSIPQELHAIVERFRVPVIPIIEISEKYKEESFSMFVDNYKYDWVHHVIKYSSEKTLFDYFEKLIDVAEKFHEKITASRNVNIDSMRIEDI
jgi:uncharacterized protein YjbI with pentapeptide repeats